MNIIRTQAVELSEIPAVAYKQKLTSGGAGIKILRIDNDQTAVCTVDKRTGEMVPYGKCAEELFPPEAFEEAFELTAGLPYAARPAIRLSPVQAQADDVPESAPPEQADMTLSPEYRAIVERYSDENGKLNYHLMNRDFIKFAAKSKMIADMVNARAEREDILICAVKNRAAAISGQRESLDDGSAALLIESLDEIDPRSAFKELKAYINRMLAKRGKA